MSTYTQKHDAIAADIKAKFGDAVIDVDRSFDDCCVVVDKSVLHDVLAHVRDAHKMNLLLDVLGVDCLELEEYTERFELEYVLYSVPDDTRLRVRTLVPETDLDLPTVTDLWQAANWGERETFEMFGFNFVGHPCQKRLLTHHEFEGHPLRKDYPVMQGQWCSSSSDLTEELNEEQGGTPS